MNSIATQMVAANYNFYGGGGLASPTGPAANGDTGNNIWNLLSAKGYTVLDTKASILELKTNPKDKVVCINPWLQDSAAMPYAIDRPDTNLSLAEMTEVAISTLLTNNTTTPNAGLGSPRDNFLARQRDNFSGRQRGIFLGQDQGFFLMVEGGKIDWACHANDAMATIGDVLDFDDAVGVALDFYQKYPRETLIVVTGDHETGGMTVGHATTGYTAYYDRLLKQTKSFTYFAQNQWAAHKAAYSNSYDYTSANNLESNPVMLNLMESVFGLKWADLNDFQKEKLEDAYDQSMCGMNNNPRNASNKSPENELLYGTYEPIIVTITHILNERASIGWSSFSHTGVPVPVFAIGPESQRFSGFYDNTDIAKQMAKAMNIPQELPVEKPAVQ